MLKFEAIKLGSKILKEKCPHSHLLDSELILSKILEKRREAILTEDDCNINYIQLMKFNNLIHRRNKQEPIAYIFGKKEFWKKEFSINKDTLIPRPETELLVEQVINLNKINSPYILDIGTGSGCILLSIIDEINAAKGIGLDISYKALKVAKKNAKNLKLDKRVNFVVGFEQFKSNRKFDIIVSNPPYINSYQMNNLPLDVKKFEPTVALNGGNDGLDVIRKVIYKAVAILKIKGMLALEIGHGQYKKVSQILKNNNFREKNIVKDYKNNIRCIVSVLENKKN